MQIKGQPVISQKIETPKNNVLTPKQQAIKPDTISFQGQPKEKTEYTPIQEAVAKHLKVDKLNLKPETLGKILQIHLNGAKLFGQQDRALTGLYDAVKLVDKQDNPDSLSGIKVIGEVLEDIAKEFDSAK